VSGAALTPLRIVATRRGAGFAGGIISAAIDGEKCALKIAESLSK